MDDITKNNNPDGNGPEQETTGQEIKLWNAPKKTRGARKTVHVYEITPSEEEPKETDTENAEPKTAETQAPKTKPDMKVPKRPKEQEASQETEEKTKKKRTKIKYRKKAKEEVKEEEAPKENQSDLLSKDNLSRAERRKILKQQMIEGTAGTRNEIADIWNLLITNYKKVLFCLLVLALVITSSLIYNRNRMYHKYDTQWQLSSMESSDSRYVVFNDVILHYSRNGVSCISQTGETLWNQAFNMDIPTLAVCKNYAVIYDVKGKSIYILNKEGCTGKAKTTKSILKADISASGVVAVVLDDTTCNYINYYDKDGKLVDLEIKTLISGDGYPLDIAVSPNGTELMTSYIYTDAGNMLNQVVFRNFEVGKTDVNRVVGGFRQYESSMVPDVLFFDDDNACAITENSIDFYNTKRANKPALGQTQSFSSNIRTVFYNEEYIGVILSSEVKEMKEGETLVVDITEGENETETEASGETAANSYKLIVYDKSGSKVFQNTIGFDYDTARFTGDGIVVFNQSHAAIYNMNGVCKYEANLDMNIDDILRFSETSIVIQGDEALRMLKLR